MGDPLWQSVLDVREAEIALFAELGPAEIIEAVRYRY